MARRLITVLAFASFLLLTAGVSFAVIVDFAGGTAYRFGGGSVVTSDTMNPFYYGDVDYYIEDGIKVDFVGSNGIIGRYYDDFGHPEFQNSVLHAHWGTLTSIVFTKVDGTAFDLNYMDLSSNTQVGGGLATGNELSYVTASNGFQMLLPVSDWGTGYLSTGALDDDVNDIERLWLSSNFDGITSFTVTSLNAYCFGLDNFYIDEPPPPPVPEPAAALLLGSGLAGLAIFRRRK